MAEIDTPGHTSIIAKAHPEHVACFEASPWTQFANGMQNLRYKLSLDSNCCFIPEPPAGQLRFASPDTTKFTAALLKAAASLFSSKLFSTGGDELNANCYTKDPATQKDLGEFSSRCHVEKEALNVVTIAAQGKTLEQALDTFTQATHSALKEIGKRAVVWEGSNQSYFHGFTQG